MPVITPKKTAYLTPDQACHHFDPVPNITTLYGWMNRGVVPKCRSGKRKNGGERVYLDSTIVGGRKFTTLIWIEEFQAACNGTSQ